MMSTEENRWQQQSDARRQQRLEQILAGSQWPTSRGARAPPPPAPAGVPAGEDVASSYPRGGQGPGSGGDSPRQLPGAGSVAPMWGDGAVEKDDEGSDLSSEDTVPAR